VKSPIWLWVLLYAYSFRILLDFSGYTDIAIGMGMLTGITLPENFNQPYRQTDIGAFWNRWHITLAQWFRSYVFNPVTRFLRQGLLRRTPWLIILLTQSLTMLLIGLWHGVTWTFAAWGLWHALGLFIHNRWVDLQRRLKWTTPEYGLIPTLRSGLSAFVTFQFVSLGWVWFASPDLKTAVRTLMALFGGELA
jgi:D-alanyl-lipoteichoic acid acyltransferase DltB (MBOAT superfamily)